MVVDVVEKAAWYFVVALIENNIEKNLNKAKRCWIKFTICHGIIIDS